MTPEFFEALLPQFLASMGERLRRAQASVAAAQACMAADDATRAIEIALDIEPLLYEVTTLLNAASLVSRTARTHPSEG